MIRAEEANRIATIANEKEIKKEIEELKVVCETLILERAEFGYKYIRVKVSFYVDEVIDSVIQYFKGLGYNTYLNHGYLKIIWEDEEV